MKIESGHGAGGKLMNDLIESVIKKHLGAHSIYPDDSAVLELSSEKIAFTTDSYTVSPLFFPGGNIGSLAINGTVNDLAVMGARPQYLSCGLIIEEGFLMKDLEIILQTMAEEAQNAEVSIVTGDTKVVPKGAADGIFINTAGIGIMGDFEVHNIIEPGDKVIINGSIGDHGMAIMKIREQIASHSNIISDCAHLNHLINSLLSKFPNAISFMRDATRGGVASVLHEIVSEKSFGIKLIEQNLPIKDEVQGIADLLGIDPLYIANEGKVVMIIKNDFAESLITHLKDHPLGGDSAIIGEVIDDFAGMVYVETEIGGRRMVPLLIDEQLPRIC